MIIISTKLMHKFYYEPMLRKPSDLLLTHYNEENHTIAWFLQHNLLKKADCAHNDDVTTKNKSPYKGINIIYQNNLYKLLFLIQPSKNDVAIKFVGDFVVFNKSHFGFCWSNL